MEPRDQHAAAMPAPDAELVLDEDAMLREEREKLAVEEGQGTALCLSGGGVRSAAFCLGVIQVLADRDLLDQFTYLSTVSGGGYIAGFLRRAIAQREEAIADPAAARPGLGCYLKDLLRLVDRSASFEKPESPEMKALRRNTSFLAPDPGFASLDTWAGIVLWLRNTLIIWTVFLPLLIGAAGVAVSYLACARLLCALPLKDASWDFDMMMSAALSVLSLALLAAGIYKTCTGLPSHSHPDAADTAAGAAQGRAYGVSWRDIRAFILMPVWAWIFIAPLALAPLLPLVDANCTAGEVLDPPGLQKSWLIFCLPAGAFVVACLSFEVARHRLCAKALFDSGAKEFRSVNRTMHQRAFSKNRLAWVASACGSALLLALGVWLVQGRSILWLVLLGPAWVMLCEILRSTFYVALRRHGIRADLDREWLARLNAAKLQLVLVTTACFSAALALPSLVLHGGGPLRHWLVTAFGIATGPVAALFGKSALTAFAPDASSGIATRFLPQAWIIGLAILFAAAAAMLAGGFAEWLATSMTILMAPAVGRPVAFALAAIGTAVFGIRLGVFIDGCVNLNRFSMHAVYRNRLVRGFLGSARARDFAAGTAATPPAPGSPRSACGGGVAVRHPDLFTQFDPADNIRLCDSWGEGWRKPLFPVINMALNETVSQDVAHEERKAISFTMTPLRCGAKAPERLGHYVRTRDYAGVDRETGPQDKQNGVTLGTAMTISGAAVSPNMGYQSSPALAFIMTLFNVRLGAWLPNPAWKRPGAAAACALDTNRNGPRFGLVSLLDELAGRASDSQDFVYLSDGGHFDNLGVYEMLRRRCRLILVVDAGRDKDYRYEDLGRALQRARLDFGATVEFVQDLEVSNKILPEIGVFADIHYRAATINSEGSTGSLIYIKPWLPPRMPMELAVFKVLKQNFPHENTIDQFFTESDFESYRRLGEVLTETLISASVSNKGSERKLALECLFDQVGAAARSSRLKLKRDPTE